MTAFAQRGRLIAGVLDACLGQTRAAVSWARSGGSTLPHLTSPKRNCATRSPRGRLVCPAGALDARARVTVARGLRSRAAARPSRVRGPQGLPERTALPRRQRVDRDRERDHQRCVLVRVDLNAVGLARAEPRSQPVSSGLTGSARRRLLPRQAPQPVGDRSSIATGLTAASLPVSLRAERDLSFPATGPTASSSPVSLRTALLRVPQLIEQRRNVCSGVDNKFCVGVRLHSNVSGAHTPTKKRHRRVARSEDIPANSPPGAWSDGRQTRVNSVDVNHCVRVHRSLLSEDEELLSRLLWRR